MDDRNRTGNCSELLVALDLTKRGYELFHSMDGKTSCDFIILKGNILKRVEVKSRKYIPNLDSKEITTIKGKADILAMVMNGVIYYIPPFE